MTVARKITLWIGLSVLFMVGISIILGYLWSFNLMRNTIGNSRHDMAVVLAADIAENINRRFVVLKADAGSSPENPSIKELLNNEVSHELLQLSRSDGSITDIFFSPLHGAKIGKTGHAIVIDESGVVLYGEGVKPFKRKFANEKVVNLINESDKKWSDIGYLEHNDRPDFISWNIIDNPILAKEGIKWIVVVLYDKREVYRPLYALLFQGALLLSVMLLFTSPIGYILGRAIVKPIEDLKEAVTDVAFGGLDRRISIKTGDELEDLAEAFNKMAADLEKTMVSRDSLMKEMIGRDIAEKAAVDARNNWQESFDAISDMVTIQDLDFNIIQANKAAQSGLGLAMNSILADKCFRSYHGKECPPEGCASCGTLKTGEPTTTEIYEPHLKKFIEIKAMPRFDVNHNVIGLVHVVRDITERKEAEEKLRQVLSEEIRYREIMASMLEDNNYAREKLENSLIKLKEAHAQLVHSEKMEAVGKMASGVAHEVKNPLGVILQGINYFEEVLPSGQKDGKEVLEMMKDNIKRADDIVRALLDFSRAEELKAEEQSINAIIESSINLVQHKLKLNSVEHVCELGKGLPNVLLDKGKIQQVLINLFNNAADAMPKGGKLHVRSHLSELKVPQEKVGHREDDIFKLGEEVVMVEVEDTGTGMDENTMSKIFDPFFTTKDRTEGTGLGLSIVKSIIDMHNSLINVESENGKGTKFTIVFKIP